MLDGLLAEVAGQGRTVVMTSHDLQRAAALADRVDVLAGGVIAASLRRGEQDTVSLPELYGSVIGG